MSRAVRPRLLPRLTFVPLTLIFACVLLLGRSVRRDRPIQSISQSLSLLIRPHPSSTAFDNHRLLVVVVLSHVLNAHRRTAIRRSWARDAQNGNCSVFFVVGTTADANVTDEAQQHGDIVQVNVEETYLALASKLKPAFAYLLEHANFDYLLKTDDDVFVNLPLLTGELVNYDDKKAADTMIGYQISGATVSTNQSDKYFAVQLMAQLIPPYLSGTGYVMSRRVLRSLLECPLPPMPYEDVYFTGVCREHINVSLEHSERFGYSRRLFVPCALRRSVIAHGLSAEQMTAVYTLTLSSNWRC